MVAHSADQKTEPAKAPDIIPLEAILPPDSDASFDEGNNFFGNLDEVEARLAQDDEAKFTRARMAFLFGYYDLARDLWMPLANDGNAKAQANVGWMYQSGKGVEKDLNKAFDWYIKAATQGHQIAQNNVGVMYEKGWGRKQNLKRAVYWYREAASTGYPYAQSNLGKMLLDGRGVQKNPLEAAYWLGLAALQGVDDAKGMLINKSLWSIGEDHAAALQNAGADRNPKQQQVKEVLREPWILNQPASSYTLQLLSSKDEQTVTQYLADPQIPDPSAYYKATVFGENWYSVIYGVFPSFEAAQHHMSLLSAGVLRYKPWVRKYEDVQHAINTPIE